jgi:hypothetical protein
MNPRKERKRRAQRQQRQRNQRIEARSRPHDEHFPWRLKWDNTPPEVKAIWRPGTRLDKWQGADVCWCRACGWIGKDAERTQHFFVHGLWRHKHDHDGHL